MGRNNDRDRDAKKRAPKIDPKKFKKKSPPIAKEIDYIDYKDLNFLRKYMSERGKIKARRTTGLTPQQQRELARAIKNARELALLPYSQRIMTDKAKSKPRRGDDDRDTLAVGDFIAPDRSQFVGEAAEGSTPEVPAKDAKPELAEVDA